MAERDNPVEINEHALDAEWLRQAKLYKRYADRLAAAEHDLRVAEGKLDIAKATAALEIRRDVQTYGIDGKLTEETVKAQVVLHPLVTDAVENVQECQKDVAESKAWTRAMEHRKAALENLVYLHGQSYFAEPRERGGGKTMKEKQADAAFKARPRRNRGDEE